MSAPRAHASPHNKGSRLGSPQPNGNGLEGQPQTQGHLLDPRNRGEVGGTNMVAATPTSMYAQHGDATPPPHNLSGAEFSPDPRHPHASYATNGPVVDSVVQPLNGHMNHNGAAVNSNGGQQQDFEKRNDFNQYLELDDEAQKSGGMGMQRNMVRAEGLGYTAPQLKQPLHSLSESY